MNSKNKIVSSLAGLGFFLVLITNSALAQNPEVEMPAASGEQTSFQKIEQPLSLKLVVALGGLGLIGAELWWFMFSKTKASQAVTQKGIQEVEIVVDGGYEPSLVEVEAGRKVRLNFLRRDRSSCLEKVLLPDFHIARDLTIDRVTPIEFTPTQPGEYPFTCGMNMYRGTIKAIVSQTE
ncbi:cupredoxin domain-containing protein [Myxosarcina sp. GI1]|uniref:cupredoxin domain-containing protein n=1 Tax=Myxosarcina sp. GI1 TaxID=1541065 RepID=UPI000565C9C5